MRSQWEKRIRRMDQAGALSSLVVIPTHWSMESERPGMKRAEVVGGDPKSLNIPLLKLFSFK